MKKRKWSDRWLTAGLMLLSLRSAAQDSFHYRMQVDTPAQTDFYQIALSPEIVATSKTDLSDVRIVSADGQFVPYVLKEKNADAGEYEHIPGPATFLVADSGNWRTIVTLWWSKRYRFDLLSLTIKFPTLYKRDARIFYQGMDGNWTLVAPVSIDPRDTAFALPAVRTRGLRIEIDNADNPPLRAIGVSAEQAGIYLLAYLQAGASYALLTGNTKAGAPKYDLGYFTDTLTRRPRNIGVGDARETLVIAGGPGAPVAKMNATSADRGGFLLWSILTTTLLLLIYFSVKMVSAIGAKKSTHDRV